MNSVEIERKLEEAFDAIHGLQAENRDHAVAAATAKADYEVTYAKALLVSRDKGLAVEAAKAEATLVAQSAYREMVVAEAKYRANRQAIGTLSTQVDILRSLAASHRSIF
jgi:hypothetical protein